MKVLITGGAGFIGSHLVRYHLARGDEVVVVDDLSTGSQANLSAAQAEAGGASLTFHHAELVAWNKLTETAGWAERIYHMAAVVGVFRVLADPISVVRANIAGTERLMRAVQSSGTRPEMVIASSSEVYGPANHGALQETSPLVVESTSDPRWTYAVTKLADEAIALTYGAVGKLPLVVVRLFNTTGPRQTGEYGMVVPRFVRQAVAGKAITVYGDGTQTRCFCDVRDTVLALDLLASTPAAYGEVVNVGGDREISIGELAELVRARSANSCAIKYISYKEAYGGAFRDFATRRPSLAKLQALTGFRQRIPLEQTLEELIAAERARVEAGVEAV